MSRLTSWGRSEIALVVLFVTVTGYIFYGSFLFDRRGTHIYPRLTGGITLVLLAVFLTFQILPDDLQEVLSTSHEALTYGVIDEEVDMDTNTVWMVFIIFSGYVLTSILIGFFLATPLFTHTILRYFGYGSTRKRAVITAAAMAIVGIAYAILRIPIATGMLIEMIL